MAKTEYKEYFYQVCFNHLMMTQSGVDRWVDAPVINNLKAGENVRKDLKEVYFLEISECPKCKGWVMAGSMKKWANNLWKKNRYTGAVAYNYDAAKTIQCKDCNNSNQKGGDKSKTLSDELQVIHVGRDWIPTCFIFIKNYDIIM